MNHHKTRRTWVGSVSNKHNPSMKLGMDACISSRITTVIHVMSDHQINYNCFNEPFAVSPYRSLYWDMHGLIFETSIWLLAGSTRFLQFQQRVRICNQLHSIQIQISSHCCTTFWNSPSLEWDHSRKALAKLEINLQICSKFADQANLRWSHCVGMRFPSQYPQCHFYFCHWLFVPFCRNEFKTLWIRP